MKNVLENGMELAVETFLGNFYVPYVEETDFYQPNSSTLQSKP